MGLLPGALTPTLQGRLSRLGSRLSFAVAADELEQLKGVRVAAATARRRTKEDGARYAALQDAATIRLLAQAPPPPAGPAVQQVSVDGTMVHLTDGSWREVRLLAIGTVGPGRRPEQVQSRQVSYFARLTDAASFTALAAGEVHRRGVETAGVVAGVVDGAPWCQTFLDTHRPDAVRILDLPHAAQRLTEVAEAVWGDGPPAIAWAAIQRRELRDGAAATVLGVIHELPVATARDPTTATQVQAETLGYLTPRLEQMRYAEFRAQGLPIGSGMVESGNKLVVDGRLGGAGRRWAEANVTPMVALRSAVCSERWHEAWTAIARARRQRRPPPAPTPVVASAASVAAPLHRPPPIPGSAGYDPSRPCPQNFDAHPLRSLTDSFPPAIMRFSINFGVSAAGCAANGGRNDVGAACDP
ncbi:MAG: hypothetical protein M3464_13930 [Chloroflexota bacterium]|nr:hypothetical protein [Chloroflexota bacterium]